MSAPDDARYGCRWSYVPGPTRGHLSLRTMVWICEHPFRTVRLAGPCEDCHTKAARETHEVRQFDGPKVA